LEDNNDFHIPGGEEYLLGAPQTLDDEEFQRLLREAQSQGNRYIAEISAILVGEGAAMPTDDQDNVPDKEDDTADEKENVPPKIEGPVSMPQDNTNSLAVAILVKAHNGSVACSMALIVSAPNPHPADVLNAVGPSEEHSPYPADVLNAVRQSKECHMLPVKEMLDMLSPGLCRVYTAKEPLSVVKCEGGDWKFNYCFLGTLREVYEYQTRDRLEKCQQGVRQTDALTTHPSELSEDMPLYFLYIKELVSQTSTMLTIQEYLPWLSRLYLQIQLPK
jgi:hypothetical protein